MTSRAEPDRRRYHDEAGTLLSKAVWTTGDVDQAVLMHDLLETPEGTPDPVAKKLRDRLTGELERRLALAENPADRIRHQFFSSRLLDVRDAFARRLFLWFYLGVTRFADYQSGARGQLDAAADAFLELDRMIRAQEPRAAALLGGNYDSVLLGFAAACYVRYGDRRELLQGDLPPGREREIRADLDHAIDASQRVAGNSGSPARAEGLAALGSCYACRYEDDARYRGRETIDEAIALLRDALRLAEATARKTGRSPAAVYSLLGIRDRLAGALAIRDTLQDVDAAIALYAQNRDEAEAAGLDKLPGPMLSLTTAYIRRWVHTGRAADRDRARRAYLAAFAAVEATHLPTAFDIAAQWGGLAWQQRWWAEAAKAYQQAVRVMHLAVRQQGNRSDREWIIRKAPGVASRGALSLARTGAPDDALVTLETGRAVLLAEMFDRRTIDYERIASRSGRPVADEYQRLTNELTLLEARLLLAGSPDSQGYGTIAADLEERRRQRAVLLARMGSGARSSLDVIDGPLAIAELREAAGPATVVYLAATGEGGLALILRPNGAPVEPVELEDLTMAAAMEFTAALEHAVGAPDSAVCVEVCEQLWLTAMARLLPQLRDAREVVLIPGGALTGLPWHAAKRPGPSGGYVLDELAISYMPNIRSLPVTRKAWENMPRRMRALAVEVPEPTGNSALPATANEVAAIQTHSAVDFPVTLLSGAEATARRLRDAMAQHELLHFAGHAFADPNDPLAGALALAHGEYLTVRELMASEIGVGRFAVLSACETARVDDLMSDEMVSFPTALMQCGFSGVVGSLWPVPDRPTSRLMEAFYEQWRGNRVSPRHALRAAQQIIHAQRRSTPLTWASFVYVGPLSPGDGDAVSAETSDAIARNVVIGRSREAGVSPGLG